MTVSSGLEETVCGRVLRCGSGAGHLIASARAYFLRQGIFAQKKGTEVIDLA